MTVPGFTATHSLSSSAHHHVEVHAPHHAGAVTPAIPPCRACDRIMDLCAGGRLRGQVCGFCAAGVCDPQDWRNPPHPFPRSEPWDVPF